MTLDDERLSWIPVVYFNIIRALRMIFIELDYQSSLKIAFEPMGSEETQKYLSSLRLRLLPLLALETTLTSELSGGVSISGGRNGVYVRPGWQALVTPLWNLDSEKKKPTKMTRMREVTILVARMLMQSVEDIEKLWVHEALRFYTFHRKIRLDDAAS